MRLWSLHPDLLDQKGLVAVWREGLLAQKVLAGNTKGYKNHPQLIRFKACIDPLAAIGFYLQGIQEAATNRGYKFNASKILRQDKTVRIPVMTGQVIYEHQHLQKKVAARSDWYLPDILICHPIFDMVAGGIEPWEVL